MLCSWSVTLSQDSLKNTNSVLFSIPRKVIDFYNVQSVKYDSLQKENIRLYYINNLYKQSLEKSVKMDNIQEQRHEQSTKVVAVLSGNYKQMRKRVVRMRLKNIFQDIKEPVFLIGGFVLGFVVNQAI
ncbi:hypothetical protein MCERE19_01091 [Spirosomataceae bacterium]|jgi:hypothetical protein